MTITPPIPLKKPKQIEQFGHVRTDNYAWMKDENWQKVLHDPSLLQSDIAEYLKAENQYSEAMMNGTKALQNDLFEAMKGRLAPEDSSPPQEDGTWLYASRFEKDLQYRIYFRISRETNKEEILLDINARARQFDYYQLGAIEHSPDHRLLAYAEDTQGSEIWRISIKDLATGKILPQYISDCNGDFTFSGDSQYLFWVYRDENGRPTKIYRRNIATGQDKLVYLEQNPGFFLSIQRSLSNNWLYITAKDHDTSEIWVIPAAQPTLYPICITKREKSVIYDVTDWDNHFIIKTNIDRSCNFKLMRVAIPSVDALTKQPGILNRERWQEWIPYDSETYIIEMIAYQNYLVRLERNNVNTRIQIIDKQGKVQLVAGDEEAYVISLDSILDPETDWLYYSYQSPTTPRQWWKYHMKTGEKKLIKAQQIPSGHDPNQFCTKRLWAPASDGQLIPITVTYHKDTPLDGSSPLLLYGYGSYGHAIDPNFSIINLNYLKRGWIYAIAHIRGGSEKGWNWFLSGRKFEKINSFMDFIECAEYLISHQYTRAGRIVADGRSAGGMVMGAITNMRPDLFAAIIAVVPFVDVLNTMSDETLPLTPPEWPEWGNPIHDMLAYTYIASYSPYDNIAKKAYPAILAVGGLTDPRVTYWEPAKWIAKLRENNFSRKPQLLKINMDSGHAGTAGRFDSLKEAAFIQAFACWAIETNF